MNKDQIKGKVKDVEGRVERQVGEWTGDKEKQAHGTVKQAEGKVLSAWGDVKDAGEKAVDRNRTTPPSDETVETEKEEDIRSRRKAS